MQHDPKNAWEEWSAHLGADRAVYTICASAYNLHLHRWLSLFPADQFLLLPMSAYITNPGAVMAAAGRHLGLATEADQLRLIVDVTKPVHANGGKYYLQAAPEGFIGTMKDDVRAELDNFFAPHNEALAKKIASKLDYGLAAPFLSVDKGGEWLGLF